MVELTDQNSWTCAVHTALRCRIYPKTKAELEKHYEAARRRDPAVMCLHGFADKQRCPACRQVDKNKRRTGKGRQKDPNALKHKAGIWQGNGNKRKYE